MFIRNNKVIKVLFMNYCYCYWVLIVLLINNNNLIPKYKEYKEAINDIVNIFVYVVNS